MNRFRKVLVIFLACCSFLAFTRPSEAAPRERPGAMSMVADLPLRVLSLGISLVTSAVFVLALPFALTSGSTGDAWDALVVEPFEFTFTRPLGRFDDWREESQ